MEIFCWCSIYIYLVKYAETDSETYVRYFLFSVDKSMYLKKEMNKQGQSSFARPGYIFILCNLISTKFIQSRLVSIKIISKIVLVTHQNTSARQHILGFKRQQRESKTLVLLGCTVRNRCQEWLKPCGCGEDLPHVANKKNVQRTSPTQLLLYQV